VKVEIFSDVVCPWCAIGKRRFDRALARFAHADDVDVVWRAFELDPSAPDTAAGDLTKHLAEKYGISEEQARASQAGLTTMAEQEGLDFHFDRAQRANTFDAHRLLHYALEVGAQEALGERLFRAYFTEGAAIGDRGTLVRLAEEVGLDGASCAEILETGRYGAEVRADEADAHALGVSGVPFFVIDRQYGISGAQSAETILAVLEEAWSGAASASSGAA
jgi:predicted DsbA family dithiol-disulfide isomerase